MATVTPVTFEIDKHSPAPAWRQLYDQLRAHVDGLQPRDPVPSNSELRRATGLATGTVQKALWKLEEDGRIYTVSGRGRFVSPRA